MVCPMAPAKKIKTKFPDLEESTVRTFRDKYFKTKHGEFIISEKAFHNDKW